MEFLFNRCGLAVVTKRQTVISLGFNVWGIDRSNGSYAMAHIWPPRVFYRAARKES